MVYTLESAVRAMERGQEKWVWIMDLDGERSRLQSLCRAGIQERQTQLLQPAARTLSAVGAHASRRRWLLCVPPSCHSLRLARLMLTPRCRVAGALGAPPRRY
jgi:hypothetical protein